METVRVSGNLIWLPPEAIAELGSPQRVFVTVFQQDLCLSAGAGHKLTDRGLITVGEGSLHFKKGKYPWELRTQYGAPTLVILGGGIRFQPQPITLAYGHSIRSAARHHRRAPRKRSPT